MMKNKAKAFTLAEVLITLGIVGVVAALSAPGLIQHAASAKIGPSFARSISTIEQGLQAYMYDLESSTLLGADPKNAKKPSDLFTELAKTHMKMKSGGTDKTLCETGTSTAAAATIPSHTSRICLKSSFADIPRRISSVRGCANPA